MMNNLEKSNCIVINTSIKLFRNIKGFKFPNNLDISEGRDLFNRIEEVTKDYIKDSKVYRLWEDNINFDYYLEKKIIDGSLIENENIGGFIINKLENASIIINSKNHLRLQVEKDGYNIKEAYKIVNLLDDKIEKELEYSFDENLGYLTSDIKTLGTGMKLEVLIHIPFLVLEDKLYIINNNISRLGIKIKPLFGESLNSYGNLYRVINDITLGMSEEEIIKNIEESINLISKEEFKCREGYIKRSRVKLEDRIFRAYGILKNARLLNGIETLRLFSDLRLGVELGFLDIEKSKLDKIVMKSRNAIIKKDLDEGYSFNDLDYKRANIIRKLLNI